MPELPEMETYKRLLAEKITNRTVTHVQVEREKTVNVPVPAFSSSVRGATVLAVERRAKHLLFRLNNDKVLLLHLMLGGFMYYGNDHDRLERTPQVTLSFNEQKLYFHGLRLGYLHLHSTESVTALLANLGPEPLLDSFNQQLFAQMMSRKKGVLKSALVDQSFISGIGNCYSDEICFDAGILPKRKIQELSNAEISKLYHSLRSVLQEAIHFGGYMQTPLFQGDTLTGGFDDRCKVYDRPGEPCIRCAYPITKDALSSRKVFYCPNCQK